MTKTSNTQTPTAAVESAVTPRKYTRKKTIDYIINGEQPTLERLSAYCQDEQLATKTKAKPVAGFR